MWKLMAGAVLAVVIGLASGAGTVQAQAGIDRFGEEACRDDPHSEACICVDVRRWGLYPIGFDSSGNPEPDADGNHPVFDDHEGLWRGIPPTFNEVTGEWEGGNLRFNYFDAYGQQCSLSYVREDLRRLWYFVAAVGGLLAAMTLAWAGVGYMQESASGGDMSKSRLVVVRVVVGMVILGGSVVIWESASGLLLSHLDTWTFDAGVFHKLN